MNSTTALLPEDNYGVYVADDMDERRLIWLVKTIGEKKLRLAVESIRKKYPDTKPFVSKLLKRFQLKVPVSVFAPVSVPIYRVYSLILRDHSKIKIGFSGDWVRRAFNLPQPPFEIEEIFDVDKSFAVLVSAKIADARNLENQILKFFRGKSGYQIAAPEPLIRYFGGGKNEWFQGFAFEEAEQLLKSDERGLRRSVMSLREAIHFDISSITFTNTLH